MLQNIKKYILAVLLMSAGMKTFAPINCEFSSLIGQVIQVQLEDGLTQNERRAALQRSIGEQLDKNPLRIQLVNGDGVFAGDIVPDANEEARGNFIVSTFPDKFVAYGMGYRPRIEGFRLSMDGAGNEFRIVQHNFANNSLRLAFKVPSTQEFEEFENVIGQLTTVTDLLAISNRVAFFDSSAAAIHVELQDLGGALEACFAEPVAPNNLDECAERLTYYGVPFAMQDNLERFFRQA